MDIEEVSALSLVEARRMLGLAICDGAAAFSDHQVMSTLVRLSHGRNRHLDGHVF